MVDYRIKKLKTPKHCEIFAKNAEEHGRSDLAKEARRRAVELKAELYGIKTKTDNQGAIEFKNDEDGYFAWLTAHLDGFVLNVRAKPDPNYVVLHRASCGSISSDKLTPGAYTCKSFRKWCAQEVSDLRYAAEMEGRKDGTFSMKCHLCMG